MSLDKLLSILNSIADIAIGNEQPTDVGFKDKTTLPEMLSYVTMYPDDRKNIVAAERKLMDLHFKIKEIQHELFIIKKTIDTKKK